VCNNSIGLLRMAQQAEKIPYMLENQLLPFVEKLGTM
jgi:hypothetical protein